MRNFILLLLVVSFNSFADMKTNGHRYGGSFGSSYEASCDDAYSKFSEWASHYSVKVNRLSFQSANLFVESTGAKTFTCLLIAIYGVPPKGEPNDSCHLDDSCDRPRPPQEPEEPPSCDDPELQKQIQHAHHACKLSMPESEFFANVFKWWCENGDVYTYCGHEPKHCIQGLTCTKPDDDVPVCNPDKQECELPEPDPDTPGTPETPIPDLEIEKPEEPPENYCELFPEMCIEPELPDDPDLPNPDPDVPNDPDQTANNLLENIHTTLDSFRTNSMLDNGKDGRWQQHMLGQVRAMLKALEDGIKVSGGGGGSEAGMAALGDKLGDKLDEIKCELAEDCEGQEEKEKPSAKVDCKQSIFECKGDVIQCTLLKIQYEDTCPVEQLGELKEKMDELFASDRTDQLVEKDPIDFSKIDSKYLSNGVSFGNANCPASESVTINHFAGSTTVEISYEPACHYARIAAPIHVILAWVAGLLLIGRTQGAF
ncbi:MAG: hypothetical protein GYB40_11600 [Vibrionaceae bacterium]|nr:hypothetical protein [Vibrionaceae bacterium]